MLFLIDDFRSVLKKYILMLEVTPVCPTLQSNRRGRQRFGNLSDVFTKHLLISEVVEEECSQKTVNLHASIF